MPKVFLALALVLLSSAAQSQSNLVQLFAPMDNGAHISCATALQPADRFDADIRWWILGFWSGQNSEGGALVGKDTDSNGIIGEIERLCRQHPSMLFVSAVGKTYFDMKKAGR